MKPGELFKSHVLSKRVTTGVCAVGLTVFTSCSSGGPEADAQRMCDLVKKGEELKAAGKTDELLKVMDEAKKLGQEFESRYKEDQEAQNLIEQKVKGCMGQE